MIIKEVTEMSDYEEDINQVISKNHSFENLQDEDPLIPKKEIVLENVNPQLSEKASQGPRNTPLQRPMKMNGKIESVPESITLEQTIPIYSGETSVREFLGHLNDAALLGKWSSKYKVKKAKLHLKGLALKVIETLEYHQIPLTWTRFRRTLLCHFEQPLIAEDAYQKFKNCKQRDFEPIHEYAERLQRLAAVIWKRTGNVNRDRNLKTERQEKCLQKFLDGLLPSIRQRVCLKEPETLIAAIQISVKEIQVEKSLREHRPSTTNIKETLEVAKEKEKQAVARENYVWKGKQKKDGNHDHSDVQKQNNSVAFNLPGPYQSQVQHSNQSTRSNNFKPNYKDQFQNYQQGQRFSKVNTNQARQNGQNNGSIKQFPTAVSRRACATCKSFSHFTASCLQTVCYCCCQKGHIRNNCPWMFAPLQSPQFDPVSSLMKGPTLNPTQPLMHVQPMMQTSMPPIMKELIVPIQQFAQWQPIKMVNGPIPGGQANFQCPLRIATQQSNRVSNETGPGLIQLTMFSGAFPINETFNFENGTVPNL